jgi:hypothetical protein
MKAMARCQAKTIAVVAAALLCAVGLCPLTASADGRSRDSGSETKGNVIFTGIDANRGSFYAFAGTIVALNGDLGRDGLAVRAYTGTVGFDLDPGEGRGWQADLMLGYLFNRKGYSGGIFVGVDYQNFTLSPDDPTAPVRGTEIGAKIVGNLTSADELPYHYSLQGAYSTAFNSYWARARIGLNRSGVTFGPEVIVVGSDSFDAHRLGGFTTFKFERLRTPIELTLSAGYHFVDGTHGATTTGSSGGGDGAYGSVVFAIVF